MSNYMNTKELEEFWAPILALAISHKQKEELSARLHQANAGVCKNSCCRDMMDEYYSARYEGYKILKNGRVVFGDEEKYAMSNFNAKDWALCDH